MRKRNFPFKNRGFSIMEVVLASALFAFFAVAVVQSVVGGISGNRLALEQIIATNFATEGLEAVRSVKNQNFANLGINSGTGVRPNGGVWALGGTSDLLASDTRFSRVVKIDQVCRDSASPPSGNIVACPGTATDNNTWKISSTVSWPFTAARNLSVVLTTYLTNWKAALSVPTDALIVYGDSTAVSQPKTRAYTNSSDSFNAEGSTGSSFTDSQVGKSFKIKTSPTKHEAVAGYVNGSGVLRILCYDGTNWSSDWTQTVGGTGTNDLRFGIGYENTTGDVLVVYSTGAGASNELGYRTKAGSSGCGSANWSGAATVSTVRTSGVVQWIRMEASPVSGSNTIAVAWADANSDLSAMEWTGSAFGVAEPSVALETDLKRISVSQDVLSFDIAIESLSGNLMVVWSPNGTTCTAGSNCIKYARYTSSWSSAAAIPTVADRAANIDLAANPNTNEIVMSGLDSNNPPPDLSLGYWSGSAWTGKANVDTSAGTPLAGTKLVADGWLISGATTRSVVVYMDASPATGVSWYAGNGGSFAKQSDFAPTPAMGDPKKWIDIQLDPKNKDRLMLTVSDLNNNLFAKRLVMTSTPAFTWTNSDGGAALELNLGQGTSSPFSFAYWRAP